VSLLRRLDREVIGRAGVRLGRAVGLGRGLDGDVMSLARGLEAEGDGALLLVLVIFVVIVPKWRPLSCWPSSFMLIPSALLCPLPWAKTGRAMEAKITAVAVA